MKLIHQPAEMQTWALAQRQAGVSVGFVPTMGYLHEGHLSLVRLARARADVTVVSIFVNPTQFGPNEDFDSYPRDLERDERLCREAGVDVVFAPAAEDMYAVDASVSVTESRLASGLCGASRPGHFTGVCTVVAKLFNLVQPSVAVFGEKDAQQLRVIRRMVRDLNFPVEIVAGPIVREPDGLAMSSRNARLKPEERAQAVCLRRALDAVERAFAAGERDADALRKIARGVIEHAPLARVDYIEIVDDESLEPVLLIERPALCALAVHFPSARLIDNTVLKV
ncbi:MAG: pantoate--beta-alanine ligase [Kiritimatiellae bacterium]|nr:pantoate--beta-alanine ligase [Kiritimatiellia bacterium]MDW8457756.1 pantoate--beta-alanine ligase [Verrucomicrobiota bacterium]